MNLPIINDTKVLIFTSTMAPILTNAKNLIGVSLLYFFMRNWVRMAPMMHPSGIIPMSIDCADDLLKVMWYSNTICAIVTEVISLRP